MARVSFFLVTCLTIYYSMVEVFATEERNLGEISGSGSGDIILLPSVSELLPVPSAPATETLLLLPSSVEVLTTTEPVPPLVPTQTTTQPEGTPSVPPDAVRNEVRVTLRGLTVATFNEERMQSFRQATADALNMYCRNNSEQCREVSSNQDRLSERQGSTVQASDVVITDTRDSDNGLQVQFYVRGRTGSVIPAAAIVPAIQMNTDIYSSQGFAVISVETVIPPTQLSSGALAGIIVGSVVGGMLLIVIITVAVIFCWRSRSSGKYSFAGKKDNEYVPTNDIIIQNEAFMGEKSGDEKPVQSIRLKYGEEASDEEEEEDEEGEEEEEEEMGGKEEEKRALQAEEKETHL